MKKNSLFYVHDPMCSWCWGFEPVRRQLFDALDGKISVQRLLGGLAPDSDQPMPEAMRQMLQSTWQRIETMTGVKFNHDFWDQCSPRRSTFPANRAVIAARQQGDDFESKMTTRIQLAYYQEAKNPSNDETLIELAAEIGLNHHQFKGALNSVSVNQQLQAEITQARSIGVEGFPSLVVEVDERFHPILINYTDADRLLSQILPHC